MCNFNYFIDCALLSRYIFTKNMHFEDFSFYIRQDAQKNLLFLTLCEHFLSKKKVFVSIS